jgi:hypothetical protein
MLRLEASEWSLSAAVIAEVLLANTLSWLAIFCDAHGVLHGRRDRPRYRDIADESITGAYVVRRRLLRGALNVRRLTTKVGRAGSSALEVVIGRKLGTAKSWLAQ